ncbi:hypothetical protein R5R35_014250 [Gryllus longicercus]|uniref:ATP-dependent DNA helicase PIF1 n=1 Tax=Gryllus longicercus TaxID=2509291 RepID=A0AAN9VVW7_9ORTH
MSQNNDNSSSLVCCVSLEWQNNDKGVLRRANLKTVTLRLLRNEFREIFLAVYEKTEESACKKFLLKNFAVHKKFMNEGKATINFHELHMSVMISNAPPTQLVNFLKHLYIKMCGGKNEEKPGPRARLLSGKARVLEEISPVTLQEVNGVRKPKQQAPDSTPPTGKKRTSSGILLNKAVKRSCLSSYIDPAPLTSEQKNVLNEALAGRNLFFTGSAGTGKSYLLRRIIGALPPDSTVATASTGVAACHIGGMTLHSFAGIGSGQASVERCIQLASKTATYQMWRKCKHLIIDEVSMVQGSYFEKLDKVARALKNNDRPFGGIQLILCGDFLQLPPVTRDTVDDKRFCFQSSVWDECIHASFELTQVHRQSDPVFIDILQNIRIGRVTDEISEKLNATSKQNINKEGIQATRLCSHTKEAEIINSNKLKALTGASKVFCAVDSDPTAASQLDQLTRVPNLLELKVGTQVMLMKNLNVSEGLVNGARGVVESFNKEGLPVVRFWTNAQVAVQPDRWTVKGSGNYLLTRKQLPLQLGWAFSIHKSQGLTLDCVEMSLGRVFEPGQAYVALSRAKSLQSLRVIDFNPKQVWANPVVLDFYRKFRRKMKMMEIVPLGRKI